MANPDGQRNKCSSRPEANDVGLPITIDIGQFTTQFVFAQTQVTNPSGGGLTFTIQNVAPTAVVVVVDAACTNVPVIVSGVRMPSPRSPGLQATSYEPGGSDTVKTPVCPAVVAFALPSFFG